MSVGEWTYKDVWPKHVTLPDVTKPIIRPLSDSLNDVRYHCESDNWMQDLQDYELKQVDTDEGCSPRIQYEMVQIWVSESNE